MAGTATTAAPVTIPVTSAQQAAYTVAGTGTLNDGKTVPAVVLLDPNNTGAPVSPQQCNAAPVLNQASAPQTANGASATLFVGTVRELLLGVNITAVTGTTPTLTLSVDSLGADGVWYTIWSSAAQTAAGTVVATIGVGAATNQSLGQNVRLRWVVGGTTPSFTFSASLIGK